MNETQARTEGSKSAVQRLVSHPGFFEIRRGTRACGYNESAEHWQIGVCIDEAAARVDWWYGDTLDEAANKVVTAMLAFEISG